MITINKGATNSVALTLTEKTTLDTSGTFSYLFSFINDVTKEDILFIPEDISLYPERYNLFIIEESATQSFIGPTTSIYLQNTNNSYSYTIYEQDDLTNLSPTASFIKGIVEIGKVKVEGLETTIINDIYL